MTQDAMKQALEALYDSVSDNSEWIAKRERAVASLRQAIAELESQEPVAVDQTTMELAESVGLIGPASRTHDLHDAIQRFHDLICANATIKAAVAFSRTLEAKDEPVAWKWHQAPVKTLWGHEMVVADIAIDKDNTVSVYCERDQTAKVEAMFTTPPQRTEQEPVAHCEAGPEFCQQCYKESLPTYGSEEVSKLREVIKSQAKIIADYEKQIDEPAIYPEEAYEMGLEAIAYYTHPPQRTEQEPQIAFNAEVVGYIAPQRSESSGKPSAWVGLTDEEAQWIYDNGRTPSGMMEMVEAKLKEKNT